MESSNPIINPSSQSVQTKPEKDSHHEDVLIAHGNLYKLDEKSLIRLAKKDRE
jgi:hypothetical protein